MPPFPREHTSSVPVVRRPTGRLDQDDERGQLRWRIDSRRRGGTATHMPARGSRRAPL